MKKVSIIVVTWLFENKHYLDLCIRSIFNSDYPQHLLDVIVVARPSYTPKYQCVKTVYPEKQKFYSSEAYNFGFKHTDPTSDYILMMNDDVVLTKNCISKLVNLAESYQDRIAVAPICNTDNTLLYRLAFKIGDTLTSPAVLSYKNMEPYFDQMMNAESIYPAGVIFPDYLSMSSTLMPRKIWEDCGGLDEKFHGGPDDVDFSYRIKEKDYRIAYLLDAVAWHFGSVSIGKTVSPKTWIYNTELFFGKWGKYPGKCTQSYYLKVKEFAENDSVVPEEMRMLWT